MKYILSHIQDWLTVGGPPMSSMEWLALLTLLLVAAVILNIVTDTSDPPRMIGNFLVLAAGAGLGSTLFPDWSPPIDPMASFSLALFSGMTLAALINMALFKPA
jgi:hypothetical protein